MKILLKKKKNDQFQFIGGMKVGEPSADGRGSAPPELAEQQARAGSEAAPAKLNTTTARAIMITTWDHVRAATKKDILS